MEGHSKHISSSSTSSGIEISSPATLATLPPSPALGPLDGVQSVTRKRTSWAGSDDPLRIHVPDPLSLNDDPFASPSLVESAGFTTSGRPRFDDNGTYLTAQSGPSSTSLIPPTFFDDEDELQLTANMAPQGRSSGWSEHDPERTSVSPRKRVNRYSTGPSPLSKTGSRLRNVSRNLRTMSLRVVNLAGMGLDDHIRLADGPPEKSKTSDPGSDDEETEQDLPDLRKSLPIRGRSLGFLSTSNKLRLAMYRFLLHS
jgi:hypothetical protein